MGRAGVFSRMEPPVTGGRVCIELRGRIPLKKEAQIETGSTLKKAARTPSTIDPLAGRYPGGRE
jgi:hypothetical protein